MNDDDTKPDYVKSLLGARGADLLNGGGFFGALAETLCDIAEITDDISERRVAVDWTVKGGTHYLVSTVRLYGSRYETMVFECPDDGVFPDEMIDEDYAHYDSEDEAVIGHGEMITRWSDE